MVNSPPIHTFERMLLKDFPPIVSACGSRCIDLEAIQTFHFVTEMNTHQISYS